MQIIRLGRKKLGGYAWKIEDKSRETGNFLWVARRKETSVDGEVWCWSQKSHAICRGSSEAWPGW